MPGMQDLADHNALTATSAQHTPGPTVDDLQRELLSICKRGFAYETTARVGGFPVNARRDDMGRATRQREVDEIRRDIYALNPNAALYFGWGPNEDGPRAKEAFFAAIANATRSN